jgi:signal transduction histidine kinase
VIQLTEILSRAPAEGAKADTSSAKTIQGRQLIRPLWGANNDMNELAASLPCVIYESASDCTIRTISSNVFDIIGIKAESLQGNRLLWEERLAPEDRQRLFTRLERLQTGEIVAEDHRFLDDRGLPVWVTHTFRKLERNDVIAIHGSITPLLRDVRVRSLDTAVVSQFIHKIGNHFQLINLLIGSLKKNGTSGDELESLQDTVDRAVEFARSFSLYTQIPVYLPAVDLDEIIRSVIEYARPLFVEKKVSLKALVDKSLNTAQTSADPFLLVLALSSIVQNAVEATNSGDRVTIDARKETVSSRSRSIARISIEDTGVGMGKEVLAKASAPFFSSKRERNGLGLSMAIRILEMHGGLLKIDSNEGCGTRVEVALPVSDSA